MLTPPFNFLSCCALTALTTMPLFGCGEAHFFGSTDRAYGQHRTEEPAAGAQSEPTATHDEPAVPRNPFEPKVTPPADGDDDHPADASKEPCALEPVPDQTPHKHDEPRQGRPDQSPNQDTCASPVRADLMPD